MDGTPLALSGSVIGFQSDENLSVNVPLFQITETFRHLA
jgi:hypothetical protein